jgi:lipoprotein-anchoring transpeptidase ErfK/SrfK
MQTILSSCKPFVHLLRMIALVFCASLLTQCNSVKKADVVVSVKQQMLGLYEQGQLKKTYKISTSKFGLGDRPGSNCTPIGQHQVVAKIGHGLPAGAVLKSRRWNGEVLKPNAPGRDPIVSRILWLKGNEINNRNAFGRYIYIHGTPEERRLGEPASYGCIRMGMKDVVNVFECVNVGAKVLITQGPLPISEKPMNKKKDDDDRHVLSVRVVSLQSDAKERDQAEANEKIREKWGHEKTFSAKSSISSKKRTIKSKTASKFTKSVSKKSSV